MQIVIDIPREDYETIVHEGFLLKQHGDMCYRAIQKGIVLPGHSRLIDVVKLKAKIMGLSEPPRCKDRYWHGVIDVDELVDNAPTVVPATGRLILSPAAKTGIKDAVQDSPVYSENYEEIVKEADSKIEEAQRQYFTAERNAMFCVAK